MFLERAKLTFTESKLIFNSAQTNGGAIRVYIGTLHFYECEINGNNAGTDGGAVSINRVHLYISKSNFTANTVIKSTGGTICAIESYNVRIWDCDFSSNEGNSGGALSVQDSIYALVSVKFSVFTSNLASRGGVIHIYRDKSVLIENCTFLNNSASEIGGVLIATTVSNFTITQSVFESNYATLVE